MEMLTWESILMEKAGLAAILLTIGAGAAKRKKFGKTGRVVKAPQMFFVVKMIATVTQVMFFTP